MLRTCSATPGWRGALSSPTTRPKPIVEASSASVMFLIRSFVTAFILALAQPAQRIQQQYAGDSRADHRLGKGHVGCMQAQPPQSHQQAKHDEQHHAGEKPDRKSVV